MLYLHHAVLYTPQREITNGAVLIDGNRIIQVGPVEEVDCPADAARLNASGLLLTPGFIDVQVNGAFGHDFTADPHTIWPVAAGLPRYGVTAFLPTIITAPLATTAAARQVLLKGRPAADAPPGATPLGLHVEGPFLNPAKKGAHNPAYLQPPTVEAAANWSPETGVRLVTLAPELPGATALIRVLTARGIVVSAGHSTATYAQALAGFEAGITYGTHCFNAMPPLEHREPGLPGALLTHPALTVGLIPDGIHVHPAVVALIWAAKGSHRLTLVSDAMAALGMPPGQYLLGDFEVIVGEADARLADGTLAGSILPLDAALRNLMAFTGCSLTEALPTVTTTPAALLGLDNQRGQIAPGFMADLVLLTPDLQVAATIVNGEVLYRAKDYLGVFHLS
jgi:N-acetylglucosamine-6-phosphate deacetylase